MKKTTIGDSINAMNNEDKAAAIYRIIDFIPYEYFRSKFEFIDIVTQILNYPVDTDILGQWLKDAENISTKRKDKK